MDAGCGSGRVTSALLDRLPQGRVIAVDRSESMLSLARDRLSGRLPQVRFIKTDLLNLEPEMLAEDLPVDAVFSTATFHWITDHEKLFRQIASVMKPNAQFVAQCGGEGNIENLLEVVRSLGMDTAGTWLYPSVADTEARLRSAGFDDIKVWTHFEPTPFEDLMVLADFLETICLRDHIANLTPLLRREFIAEVIDKMPEPVIDYVRLNIVARKADCG